MLADIQETGRKCTIKETGRKCASNCNIKHRSSEQHGELDSSSLITKAETIALINGNLALSLLESLSNSEQRYIII